MSNEIRSLLLLAAYYRKFVKDYAVVAISLTKYLRGDSGHVGTKHSKQVNIDLDSDALNSFEKIKKNLLQRMHFSLI